MKEYSDDGKSGLNIRGRGSLAQMIQDVETGRHPKKGRTSAEGLVSAFRREQQRQRSFVLKAKVCEDKLTFIVTAFRKPLADDNLVNLLRAEGLSTLPAQLANKLKQAGGEEA